MTVPDYLIDEANEAAAVKAERDRYKAAMEEVSRDADRYREALREADEELALIADDASEDIGERIDSVRALLKDACVPR